MNNLSEKERAQIEKRIESHKKCAEYICEECKTSIKNIYSATLKQGIEDFHIKILVSITANTDSKDDGEAWNCISTDAFTEYTIASVINRHAYLAKTDDTEEIKKTSENIRELIFCYKEQKKLPVVCVWTYRTRDQRILFYNLSQPSYCIIGINIPWIWEESTANNPPSSRQKTKRAKESQLENELLSWLNASGIKADKQVSLKQNRTDIWIPGVCFLELKRGGVTTEAVCQAIEYYEETDRKIILVGDKAASRVISTIEAFNRLLDREALTFVSWSAIKIYLKGLLGI